MGHSPTFSNCTIFSELNSILYHMFVCYVLLKVSCQRLKHICHATNNYNVSEPDYLWSLPDSGEYHDRKWSTGRKCHWICIKRSQLSYMLPTFSPTLVTFVCVICFTPYDILSWILFLDKTWKCDFQITFSLLITKYNLYTAIAIY